MNKIFVIQKVYTKLNIKTFQLKIVLINQTHSIIYIQILTLSPPLLYFQYIIIKLFSSFKRISENIKLSSKNVDILHSIRKF